MRNVWEVLVVIGIVVIVAGLIWPLVQSWRELPAGGGSRKACNSNLGQIVKACTTYQEPNGDFFPAYWDGQRFDPMMSLANLYPTYIDNARVFGCPLTEDRPKLPDLGGTGKGPYAFGDVSTPQKCSYLYDALSHFRDIGPGQAMAADADGFAWLKPDGTRPDYPAGYTRQPRKPNHDSGQNVMYFDGHVRWMETNFASDDPADNIFSPQPGWGADTDAYLWDGVNARTASP